jgi:hypothetical protein
MKLDSYDMQILIVVAKACKPNSPKPDRVWWKPYPVYGIPEFGNALSRLIRDGYLLRRHGYRVKPSPAGYKLVNDWKIRRRELKSRPIIYDPIIWEPRVSDLR